MNKEKLFCKFFLIAILLGSQVSLNAVEQKKNPTNTRTSIWSRWVSPYWKKACIGATAITAILIWKFELIQKLMYTEWERHGRDETKRDMENLIPRPFDQSINEFTEEQYKINIAMAKVFSHPGNNTIIKNNLLKLDHDLWKRIVSNRTKYRNEYSPIYSKDEESEDSQDIKDFYACLQAENHSHIRRLQEMCNGNYESENAFINSKEFYAEDKKYRKNLDTLFDTKEGIIFDNFAIKQIRNIVNQDLNAITQRFN